MGDVPSDARLRAEFGHGERGGFTDEGLVWLRGIWPSLPCPLRRHASGSIVRADPPDPKPDTE